MHCNIIFFQDLNFFDFFLKDFLFLMIYKFYQQIRRVWILGYHFLSHWHMNRVIFLIRLTNQAWGGYFKAWPNVLLCFLHRFFFWQFHLDLIQERYRRKIFLFHIHRFWLIFRRLLRDLLRGKEWRKWGLWVQHR